MRGRNRFPLSCNERAAPPRLLRAVSDRGKTRLPPHPPQAPLFLDGPGWGPGIMSAHAARTRSARGRSGPARLAVTERAAARIAAGSRPGTAAPGLPGPGAALQR